MKEHRIVGTLALALLLTCVIGIAKAGTLTFNWINPTQFEDNTPIASGDITQTRVEWSICNASGGFGTKAGEVINTGSGTTASKTGIAPGTYCSRAYTTAKGVESIASNVVQTTVTQPAPKPPQLTVVATQAYMAVPDYKNFAFNAGKQIGTVKLGAACDESRTVGDGYFAVVQYKAAVKLFPGVKPPEAVLAKCGA